MGDKEDFKTYARYSHSLLYDSFWNIITRLHYGCASYSTHNKLRDYFERLFFFSAVRFEFILISVIAKKRAEKTY